MVAGRLVGRIFLKRCLSPWERQAPAWPVGCRMISIAELELSVPRFNHFPAHPFSCQNSAPIIKLPSLAESEHTSSTMTWRTMISPSRIFSIRSRQSVLANRIQWVGITNDQVGHGRLLLTRIEKKIHKWVRMIGFRLFCVFRGSQFSNAFRSSSRSSAS